MLRTFGWSLSAAFIRSSWGKSALASWRERSSSASWRIFSPWRSSSSGLSALILHIHRKIYSSLIVYFDNLYFYFLSNRNDVVWIFNKSRCHLGNVDHSFFTGQEFNKCSKRQDSFYFPVENFADCYFSYKIFYPVRGLFNRLFIGSRN